MRKQYIGEEGKEERNERWRKRKRKILDMKKKEK